MYSLFSWTICLLPFVFLVNILVSLAKNIKTAKSVGIPYVIVPYYAYNRITSLILGRTLLRLTNKLLPPPGPTSWRLLVTPNWPWKLRHEPFAKLGSDTFLTVAPGGIIVHTADADVISQVTARQSDFPKASHLYKSVNIYGHNIVSAADGPEWRRYRKAIAPTFTENLHEVAFEYTRDETFCLIGNWTGAGDASDPRLVKTMAQDTMMLSLNVMSQAALGMRMYGHKFNNDEAQSEPSISGNCDRLKETEKDMSFMGSLRFLLSNILLVMVVPGWWLKRSRSPTWRKAHEAYTLWGRHMRNLIASRQTSIFSPPQYPSYTTCEDDILSTLIKNQTPSQAPPQIPSQPPFTEPFPQHEKSIPAAPSLTNAELLSNAFVLLIAGHETSASSIHFCLMLLALHPRIQSSIQRDLDVLFSHRPPTEWSYDDIPRLLTSSLAGVLNEELRLIAPVITIPKIVAGPGPQMLCINNREAVLPPKTMVRLCIPSVHRNPNFWPTGPASSPLYGGANDLEEFKPARWLNADGSAHQPAAGSYIPFSAGARSCLGKRFAQIEILTCLAVVLSTHSVELDVSQGSAGAEGGGEGGGGVSDEELDRLSQLGDREGEMGHEAKKRIWRCKKEEMEKLWREKMVCVITLQLRGEGACVPVRFVERGRERFGDCE